MANGKEYSREKLSTQPRIAILDIKREIVYRTMFDEGSLKADCELQQWKIKPNTQKSQVK